MTDSELRRPGEGGRISLRRPSISDLDALVELRSDPAVRQYLGGPVTAEVALEKAKRIVASDAHFVVEAEGDEVAGLVSLTSRGVDVELSYEFFPAFWGQGIARMACEDLLDRVTVPESARLIAVTQRSNQKSRRLLHSLGFAPTTSSRSSMPSR